MAFSLKNVFQGTKEMTDALRDLGKRKAKAAARAGATAGGQIVLVAARRLVPVELGILKKSLGKKVKVYPNGNAVAVIGPRHGFRQPAIRKRGKWAPAPPPPSGYANPLNYAHLVEGGTFRSRAFAPLQTALSQSASAAVAAIAAKIEAAQAGNVSGSGNGS